MSTAASNKVHFSVKFWLPKSRNARRISLTRENHKPSGLDVLWKSKMNSSICWSPTKNLEKEDESPNNFEFSTNSWSKQDKSVEDNNLMYRRKSNRLSELKLHLNKRHSDFKNKNRSIEAW